MSKYLKKFETEAQYTAAKSGLILPNVSLITENNKVEYNPLQPTPFEPTLFIIDASLYMGDQSQDLAYININGTYYALEGENEYEETTFVAFEYMSSTHEWGTEIYQGSQFESFTYNGYQFIYNGSNNFTVTPSIKKRE